MSEQLKKETGLSQPAGSEGPKKSAAKKSFFRSRSGEKKKSAAKSAEPTGQKKSAAKKAPDDLIPFDGKNFVEALFK